MFMIMFMFSFEILEICPDVRVMSFGSGSVRPNGILAGFHDFHSWDMYMYVYWVMLHYEVNLDTS
jgi:hypothetical protein